MQVLETREIAVTVDCISGCAPEQSDPERFSRMMHVKIGQTHPLIDRYKICNIKKVVAPYTQINRRARYVRR